MRIQDVIKRIGVNRLQEFHHFMISQTCGIYEDDSINYYEQDIENFLRNPKDRFFD